MGKRAEPFAFWAEHWTLLLYFWDRKVSMKPAIGKVYLTMIKSFKKIWDYNVLMPSVGWLFSLCLLSKYLMFNVIPGWLTHSQDQEIAALSNQGWIVDTGRPGHLVFLVALLGVLEPPLGVTPSEIYGFALHLTWLGVSVTSLALLQVPAAPTALLLKNVRSIFLLPRLFSGNLVSLVPCCENSSQ